MGQWKYPLPHCISLSIRGEIMKQLISYLMSLLVILGILSTFNLNSFGVEYKTIDVDEFSKQVRQMITEYDVAENNQETLSVQSFSVDSDEDYSEFETMRLIVKSKSQIDTLDAVSVISGYKDLWVLQFESEYYTTRAFEYYSALECVEYVEPDSIITMDTVVETFSAEKLENGHLSWGSEAIGSDEILDYLETASVDLAEVKVGVIDTGIDYNHEFLKYRMIDEGLNFSASGDDTAMSDDPDSHGTHVSGIIVDNTPKSVKIKGYKIFDSDGETSYLAVVSAVEKAVSDKMDIINCSFGFIPSESVRECFLNACNNGVVVVAAAGNENMNCRAFLPCSLDEVIVVGASDVNMQPASFSNFGKSLDILAPGVDVYSSLNNNEYGNMSGTSMATPFAVASSAILLSINPDMSLEEIEKQLEQNSIAVDGPYPSVKTGNGILNIAEAINVEHIKNAEISVDSGRYIENVTVKFTNSVDSKIFYTTDGTLPNQKNGTLYIEPFTLTDSCEIIWRTYPNSKQDFASKIDSVEIHIFDLADESEFTVSEEGTLLGYSGVNTSIVVPKVINGVAVTSVGENAFDSESGVDFKEIILPETVTDIKNSAFTSNSSIEYVVAENVENIGEKAFYSCLSLKTLDAPNVKTINAEAFKNSLNFCDFNSFNVELVDDYAFEYVEGIKELNLNSLKNLGVNAFSHTNLEKVTFSTLESFKEFEGRYCSGALYGCSYLEEIYMPSLEIWGTYIGGTRNCASLESLRVFYAPKLKSLGGKALFNCRSLEDVNLESVEKINYDAFAGCSSLKKLYLPNIKEIGRDVFQGCNLDYVYLGALEKCEAYFTKSCSVMIPASASVLMFDSSSMRDFIFDYDLDPVHLTIYGSKGSYAEQWATSEHKYCTSEFIALPLITGDLPLEISEDEGKLTVDAIGFNLSYQWYGSIDGTTENSVILEREDKEELVLENTEKYKGFYCIVSGEDGEFITSVTSNVALIKYNSADYTEYYAAIASVPEILSIYTEESVAKLQDVLSVDVSGKLSYEQNIVDEQTKTILNAISELKLKSADYSQLDKALETIPDDLSIYTDESLAELNVVLESIDKNLDITNQSQIDEWAKQVETAVKNLKIKPADYTALDEVISKIPDNLSLYTDESVAELEKVLNSIDRELDITQQEQVDNYVTTVEQAIANLNYKLADYSLVFDAIATIPNDLSIYTPESVAVLESIIDGIDYSLNITQQDKVDEYAEQIKQAVENLEEECWLVRLFRIIVSFFKDIFLCLENCIFNVFDC